MSEPAAGIRGRAERPVWRVRMPAGGWAPPWPQALELAEHLTPGSWTLVGGLMVQLHALHAGLRPPRTTVDVDVLLHIETPAAAWAAASGELARLGYSLPRSLDAGTPVHRFVRGPAGRPREQELVDVMVADHVGPWAVEHRGGGRERVRVPGGTSALRKTVRCVVEDVAGERTWEVSVPDVLGALTLKGGAYRVDSRDRERHLEDAVVLRATVEDADALAGEVSVWTGSDAVRVRALTTALRSGAHPAWAQLPVRAERLRAQAALAVLAAGPVRR